MNTLLRGMVWGYALSTLFSKVYEDLLGKERYLKAVEALWIDTKITLPIELICALLVGFAVVLEVKVAIARSPR